MAVTRSTQIHERTKLRYAAIIEKHTLNGVNTITLMKHKHRYVILVKSTSRTDGANTVATVLNAVT